MIHLDVDIALAEVPVNLVPLTDDTDFKSIEEAVAYNASGLELIWHFVTSAGSYTATVVTPTTGGTYDWSHQDGGMYTIEIPASGGASINNDTEGYGWFTGKATGVLPWRGPTIGFRAAGLNDLLCDSAYSTTRGLAGTALPAAAADAPGGLPISDAGGLDLDAKLANTHEVTAARMGALTDWINGGRLDLLLDAVLEDTGTTIPATLTTISGYIDTEVASIVSSLSTISGLLDTEIAAILADTNELQGDWANGGRLDLILDARASQTSVDDLPTNAELEARTLPAADYFVVGDYTAPPSIDDLPTNSDLATALGAADDAVLLAIAALESHGDVAWATASGFSTFDPASDTVARVTLVDTCTENTDMRGTDNAYTGTPPTADENAVALLDLANGIETGLTLRQSQRLVTAAAAGKISGAGTTTITIRNYGDGKTRITATVDEDGNREAITYDLT